MNEAETIKVNPRDYKSMIELMDKYGDSKFPFHGKNENGERVIVSVSKDNITVETFQDNDWIRKNTYWRDCTTEETYSR